MTPKSAALRFRIWQYASARGWDVTFGEVADALGVSVMAAARAAHSAGWSDRFRSKKFDSFLRDDARTLIELSRSRHLAEQIVAGRVGVDA